MKTIATFSGEHRFLSNFWLVEIEMPPRWRLPMDFDLKYLSTEHAYQAAKTLDEDDRRWVQLAASAGEAKKRGGRVVLRSDWDAVKLDVMWDLIVEKFSHPDLRERLLGTGDAELIEGNHWGDTFWGVCRGEGANHLGRILMDVRATYRRQ